MDDLEEANPEATLAAAVIGQALHDARRGDQDARAWLLDENDGMSFWADALSVEPEVIRRMARVALPAVFS